MDQIKSMDSGDRSIPCSGYISPNVKVVSLVTEQLFLSVSGDTTTSNTIDEYN